MNKRQRKKALKKLNAFLALGQTTLRTSVADRVSEQISQLTKGFDELVKQATLAASALLSVGPAIDGLAAKLAERADWEVEQRRRRRVMSSDNRIVGVYHTSGPARMIDVTTFGDRDMKFIREPLRSHGEVRIEVAEVTTEFLVGLQTAMIDGEEVVFPWPSTEVDLVVLITSVVHHATNGIGGLMATVQGRVLRVNR